MNLTRCTPALVCIAVALSLPAHPDTITVGDDRIEDVYVTEGTNAVYVCLPEEGRTVSILKVDPGLGAVTLDEDPARRDALYARYRANRDKNREDADLSRPPLSTGHLDSSFTRDDLASFGRSDAPEGSGVPLLMFRGEPAPPNPELQAIIQSNLSRAAGRGGPAATGGAPANAGRGSGGRGGGRGGSGGGSQGQSPGFSNISELFDSVDDADVGETPNPITGRV